jgi:hypothetical protein
MAAEGQQGQQWYFLISLFWFRLVLLHEKTWYNDEQTNDADWRTRK